MFRDQEKSAPSSLDRASLDRGDEKERNTIMHLLGNRLACWHMHYLLQHGFSPDSPCANLATLLHRRVMNTGVAMVVALMRLCLPVRSACAAAVEIIPLKQTSLESNRYA